MGIYVLGFGFTDVDFFNVGLSEGPLWDFWMEG